MKTLTQEELGLICDELRALKGYEVQGIYGSEDFFGIKLWNQGIKWIYFNLKGAVPFIFGPEVFLEINKELTGKKKLTKPVFTFFNRHIKQSSMKDISLKEEYGRLVEIHFESNESSDLKIQARLFRGGVNFGVFSGDKTVFLFKPQDLEKQQSSQTPLRKARSFEELKKEILSSLSFKTQKNQKDISEDKRLNNINKIKEAIKFHESDPYLRLARTLEEDQEPLKDLEGLLKKDLNKRESIAYAYEQHKLKDEKIDRLKRRLSDLELGDKPAKLKVKAKEETRGVPRLQVSEKAHAYCGRSAKENIELIRKAKAWYVWMHLKDYPSAHVVIEKNKDYELKENELKKSALFLFSRGAPKKLLNSPEVKFEIIYTEMRHVKSIKGDKTGRVTAQKISSRIYVWKKEDIYKIS